MDEISEEKEPEEGNEQDGPVNVTEASFHTTAPGSLSLSAFCLLYFAEDLLASFCFLIAFFFPQTSETPLLLGNLPTFFILE